ncbi:hypothetical protein CDL15_Pgr007635 [Punica granatum]|uniref:non-specific serine/threonine protein kinase n=1 Tax=Punica granatum TaxID=22663 RepID=A0A218X9F8_PUNGR|nr:hypothetical protein CDL15_Pgr007635 [Punica granatum]
MAAQQKPPTRRWRGEDRSSMRRMVGSSLRECGQADPKATRMPKPMMYGCIFTFYCCCLALLAAAQVTDPSEVSALRDVRSSLDDPMKHLQNWSRGDPCVSNWPGVFCYDTVDLDGYLHVRDLHLLNMNLSGSLSPALGKLTLLQILDFMWNQISGEIPKEIGNIASLKLLLLNGNSLSGSLPDELGNLSNLTRLQFDENNISGPLPKSFANLSNLRHLHLNNNSISGQIPPELSNMSRLLHFQLDNNNFDGSEIPATYGNLSTLSKLSLRNCSLVGQIPDLSRIQNLSYVDLSRNRLSGPIPSNKLSENATTINLSNNNLNGSIPSGFSDLPSLQKLSLANNTLTGSIPASLWQNITFIPNAKLTVDLQNNLLSTIAGQLNPPENVTLRLGGNPVCSNANVPNIAQFCISQTQGDEQLPNSTNSTCPVYSCPTDNNYEYVPVSPVPCFCAAPLRIGYRLKSPSVSYFPPYIDLFETYLTSSLKLERYQLSIDSFSWEVGPRLRMYLKIFPPVSNQLHYFNATEVQRIRRIYTSWDFPPVLPTQNSGISKGIIVAIVLAAVACAVSISALITFLIIRRSKGNQNSLSRKHLSSKISIKIEGVKAFTFRQMAQATNNFNSSSKVGQGGYGKVYKGILSDHAVVAIKRAEEGSLQGQREFLTEIKLLSRLHHRNLVSLVGYCDEEGEQMLVYEFMPNGTLRDWISGKTKEYLNFGMRLRIALGAAKGILYLHTEANPPVYHRDIKASNILLDSKLTAKVADFGLSRLAPLLDEEGAVPHHVSTIVKGTPGYLDPEYFLTHKLTDKSDVYSLGVVFLELLTGMQPISHGKNIVREVNMANQSGMMFSIIDSKMGSYPSECIEKFVTLALMSCDDKPDRRPSMLDVVRELESILRMMPETDALFSDTASMYSSKSFAESSSYASRERYPSSTVSGSDLISGVVPTISPR